MSGLANRLLSTWEREWPEAQARGPVVQMEHIGCASMAAAKRSNTVRLHCGACKVVVDPRDISLRVSHTEMARMPDKSTATRRSSQDAPGDAVLATPLPQAIGVLGDKWSIEVMVCAFFGVHQFGDFGARIGIATNILSDRLNRLVDAGLFRRTADGDKFRKGLYLLTAKGRAFYGILIAIQSWADDWIDHRVRSPVKLRHTVCRHTLQPLLVCADCGQALTHTQTRLGIAAPEAPSAGS